MIEGRVSVIERGPEGVFPKGENIIEASIMPSGSRNNISQNIDVLSPLFELNNEGTRGFLSSPYGQEVRNDYGSLRWGKIRGQYRYGYIDLVDVIDIYEEWRDDSEFIVRKGKRNIVVKDPEGNDVPTWENVFRFTKASKRGNDVYRYLIDEKLKPLTELPNIKFFKEDWGEKNSKFLFVTLTFDTKKCNEAEAWAHIGEEYHLFYTKMRQEYGDFEYFRAWEATGHCYPHAHVLIAFKDKVFPVFVHEVDDGKRSYRIPKNEKDKIASFWHSHVDVQAVNDTGGAIGELTKYITKDLCSLKGAKTNAMLSLFRRQSYAITEGFTAFVKGSFVDTGNMGDVGVFDLDTFVMCNCNNDIYDWEYLGVFRGLILNISSDIWFADVKKPPSALIHMVNNERRQWAKEHSGGC